MPPRLSIDEFDPLEWINDYINPVIPISRELFEPILQFALIWNLFERDACGRNANPSRIERSVTESFSHGRILLDHFRGHLQFFRDRSQLDGMNTELYLNALKMTNNTHRTITAGILNNTLHDPNNIIFGLLLIAHRIRNNLFHGEKDLGRLNSQIELFRVVNSMLATYLHYTRPAS